MKDTGRCVRILFQGRWRHTLPKNLPGAMRSEACPKLENRNGDVERGKVWTAFKRRRGKVTVACAVPLSVSGESNSSTCDDRLTTPRRPANPLSRKPVERRPSAPPSRERDPYRPREIDAHTSSGDAGQHSRLLASAMPGIVS